MSKEEQIENLLKVYDFIGKAAKESEKPEEKERQDKDNMEN